MKLRTDLMKLHLKLGNMNFIPFAFMEDVLSNFSATRSLARYKKLSGSFGKYANRWEENAYTTILYVENGTFTRFRDHRHNQPIGPAGNVENSAKYRLWKVVAYKVSDNQIPKIDPNLPRGLDEFAVESGMLCLSLRTSKIDEKWVKLFSSWKHLNTLIIHSTLSGPTLHLLFSLLDREQLVRVGIFSENYGDREVYLFKQFLQQSQFLSLEFMSNTNSNSLLKERILAEEDLKKFVGSTVHWKRKEQLHNDSFEKVGLVDESLLLFKKRNLLAYYFNDAATQSTTDEEFVAGARSSLLRFVHEE